jgi:hypothetical protein
MALDKHVLKLSHLRREDATTTYKLVQRENRAHPHETWDQTVRRLLTTHYPAPVAVPQLQGEDRPRAATRDW